MGIEKVAFKSGNFNIAGLYHAAAGSRRAVVISHGFAANKDSDKWAMVCARLSEAGVAALRFDHAGCGESDGAFEDVTLTGRIADLRAAVEYVRGRGAAAVSLIGSSFGGDTALFCAADSGINSAAIVGTPFTFDFVDIAEQSESPDFLVIDGMKVKRGLLDDVARYDVGAQAERVSRLLVMHGTLDDVVPPGDASEIYARASEPKQLVIVDGADHRFSMPQHREIMYDRFSAWFDKFWN